MDTINRYAYITGVEVGTHTGTTGQSIVPTNIPDGFFYVTLLESLEALLDVPSIFHQVCQVATVSMAYVTEYELCQFHAKAPTNCYDIIM